MGVTVDAIFGFLKFTEICQNMLMLKFFYSRMLICMLNIIGNITNWYL